MKNITLSKKQFNRFFQEDLYGRFDNEDNLILSRGSWNDTFVLLPRVFKYCLNFTLDKHWLGYSDSLGHTNVFEAMEKYVNEGKKTHKYKHTNFALTLGNVCTLGLIFKELSSLIGKLNILTFTPYYPPILKSVSSYAKKIHFTSSLSDEKDIISNIKQHIHENKSTNVIFLSNCIGIEGRIFSKAFWTQICEIVNLHKIYLVIDEGMWFSKLDYPDNINNKYVIRVVTTSKKFGIPGMKVGYILGPKHFIKGYYDQASNSYGGPASIFFLLEEFLFSFEYVMLSKDVRYLKKLSDRYQIDLETVEKLYKNYNKVQNLNYSKFKKNRSIFLKWLEENNMCFNKCYIFDGINYFIEPKTKSSAYNLFLELIQSRKVSVLPSSCLGDMEDRLVRVTILEHPKDLIKGLNIFSDFLKENLKQDKNFLKMYSDEAKIINFDSKFNFDFTH
jgi:aspartate/methionine/tyrosine aminotransferase